MKNDERNGEAMRKIKFGILATGNIAGSMAKAVSQLEEVECCAAASRSYEKAKNFADKWGFQKAYGSYEELVRDPEVELIYVASPHSHHYAHAKLCLEHGKHVLLEKAFTVNASQAEELIALARKKGLLLAEAFWPRYMPTRKMLDDLTAQGTIGDVQAVTADFGAPLSHIERMWNPELAGGALLDLGVYPINFALQVFKGQVKNIQSGAVMSPLRVDHMNGITLSFEDDKTAVLHSNMLSCMPNRGVVYGTKGFIEVYEINNPREIRVFNANKEMTASYPAPTQINGYEYEVLACVRAIEAGQVECEEMPHSETLRLMRILDEVRAQWGFRLPCE